MLLVKEKMQSVFLDVKLRYSWNQIARLLCIIYDLELIDVYSKLKHSKS